MKRFVVAGIGTDVGKTVAAAVLTETLGATYWKPVQTGSAESADSGQIRKLCGPDTMYLPEAYHFSEPVSPHLAASLEGKEIEKDKLQLPKFHEHESFVIELAGGIMVPLNDTGLLNTDLLKSWQLPVFVVTRHYLGSINHTLLTLSVLKQHNISVAGIILNGEKHEPSERIYRNHYPELLFLELPEIKELNRHTVAKIAESWRKIIG